MEDNLHGDKLDDYVRKSFKEYEETPSPDMWSRVEGAIEDPVPKPVFWAVLLRMGWQLLAAGIILILSATLVCERVSHEAQIRALTQPVYSPDRGVPTIEPNAETNASKLSGAQPDLHHDTDQHYTQDAERQSINSVVPAKPSLVLTTNSETAWDTGQKINVSESSVLKEPSKTAVINAPLTDQMADVTLPSSVEINPIIVPIKGFEEPKLRVPDLNAKIIGSSQMIHPSKTPTGWYAGIETSLMSRLGRSQTLPSRPGRPAFSSETTGSAYVNVNWIKVGKQWNNGWHLESGLGYQQWSSAAVHYPRFRFGDGTQVGNPLGNRRNFTYDLNTESGTAEVSLRMEQAQPGNPPDDEPVSLRIETMESSQWLRIPVLVGYQWGAHRWHGFANAGLLANVVFGQRLNIAATVSENARFKPVEGQDGYSVMLNKRKFVPGYWLGTGVGYNICKSLRFQAEICFSGDLPRNDVHRRRLPERYMAGLNLGLGYYF